MVAVFFLGSAPGLVTARQDWSERMVPNASGDACVERAIKRGEARGTARQRRYALWRALRMTYSMWPRTPAKMWLVAVC